MKVERVYVFFLAQLTVPREIEVEEKHRRKQTAATPGIVTIQKPGSPVVRLTLRHGITGSDIPEHKCYTENISSVDQIP